VEVWSHTVGPPALQVNFVDFIPVLEEARGLGLPITVHLAGTHLLDLDLPVLVSYSLAPEVLNHADTEAVLRFKPERVGHACYLDKYLIPALRSAV